MKINIEFELDDELWGEYKEGINPELFLEDLFSNWRGKDGVEKITLKSIDNGEVLNVNRIARVTLTEAGAKIINNYLKTDDVIQHLTKDQIKTLFGRTEFNAGDTYKSALWDIMHIFGKHMYMGCNIPFVNNEIVLL